jgi:aminodeoxyfutalosine deaminase
VPTPRLLDFIAALPKAELHVHQVGSAPPRVVAELAAAHPSAGVPADVDALQSFFTFTDFAHFVEVYLTVVGLVRTPEDIRLLTYEVARDMAAQRIRYAELICTPYTSVLAGVAPEAFCEAIEDARSAALRDFELELRWSFDIPGEFGLPAAEETLRIATSCQPDGLVSFGLGGPEIGVGREQFAPYFDAARAAGLHSVPHAGETTGAETIWDAVRYLGAERIGHGIAAAGDAELMRHLVDHTIALEVCPTSNLATRAVTSLPEHPLPALVEAGVPVTVSTDDPSMFGTTLNNEYGVAADLLGLDEAGLVAMARSAVTLSFAEPPLKRRLLAEIEARLPREGRVRS